MSDAAVLERPLSHTISACRSCGGKHLQEFLDLGTTPLADRLVPVERAAEPEPRFPLRVAICEDCSLVQITETVDPRLLFADDYPYFSSFSATLLAHSKANASDLIARRKLDSRSLVVEIASNDGYLLKNYVERGIPVLGIDPAEGPAAAAIGSGVPTLREFFTRDLAHRLVRAGKRATVVHANNVLAHVADTNGFVAGIATILEDTGVAVIEVPYVKSLIDHVEFDTIYHEHLCYFSVTALDTLFRQHGLYLNELLPLPIHGGSLRLYVERAERVGSSVATQLTLECELGLDRFGYFRDFSAAVERLRRDLKQLLIRLKREGKTIAAYGAAAKGATLLNYTGIDKSLLDFVVDRNVHKQGRLMPGCLLPILPPEALIERRPDFVLLLAWNLEEEILAQQARYRELGGRFIIPVPTPRLA